VTPAVSSGVFSGAQPISHLLNQGVEMKNDPLAALLPVLADTMKFATQALSQSTALGELLVEKGVLTKAELDGKVALGQKLRDSLMAKLNEEIRKQS
jgi:hypothetical protein